MSLPPAASLMSPSTGLLRVSAHWFQTRDADPMARDLFDRHYSRYFYADGRKPAKFIGPGEYLLLVTEDYDALFAWRKFRSMDDQTGVNCSIFRNEGAILSSTLIIEAMQAAWARWPGERLYTYVNPRKIRSSNPGCCFKRAGWRFVGITGKRKYLIFAVNAP